MRLTTIKRKLAINILTLMKSEMSLSHLTDSYGTVIQYDISNWITVDTSSLSYLDDINLKFNNNNDYRVLDLMDQSLINLQHLLLILI